MVSCLRPGDRHINVSASPTDGELTRLVERVASHRPVEQLVGLRRLLDGLLCCPATRPGSAPRTLDLLAHSTADRLLQMGSSVLDPRQPAIRRLFEQMARDEVLPGLGIHAVRLLGCETAMTHAGQDAIRALTDILGVRVLGTVRPVYAAHFGATGLLDRYELMLCDADCLPDLPTGSSWSSPRPRRRRASQPRRALPAAAVTEARPAEPPRRSAARARR